MQRKTAPATLEAFRKLIRKNDGKMPNEITADLGTEYALLGKEIEDAGGVLRRKTFMLSTHLPSLIEPSPS